MTGSDSEMPSSQKKPAEVQVPFYKKLLEPTKKPADDAADSKGAAVEVEGQVDLGYYRKLVKQFVEMRRYQSALFWAEKVCILGNHDPKDIYCQAQCMFLLKEYHRAAHTIRLHHLERTSIPCYNLLLESLYEAKEYNEAIAVINSVDVEYLASSLINQPLDGGGSVSGSCQLDTHNFTCTEDCSKNELLASVNFIKGKIYEAMDNRGLAMDFFVQALHKSVFCYEALEALVRHEMLLAWEEKELMKHLPMAQQSTEADAKFMRKIYESKLKKYYESITPNSNVSETPIGNSQTLQSIKDLSEKIEKNRSMDSHASRSTFVKLMTPMQPDNTSPANKILEELKSTPFSMQISLSRASSLLNESLRSCVGTPTRPRPKEIDNQNVLPLSACLQRIERSTDLMASEAERLFYECDYNRCLKVLHELLKTDPYHDAGLTVQISCFVECGDYNQLFFVAHKLVDRYPDKAISWYAVGCYYDLIGKSDPARRYLSKATALDRLYGPAWLSYGHSFAKENEHDQAMAAYFKATQLMRGCHLPLLYIGVECGLTKNLELAEKFFYQAMSVAPLDVFVLHELGVIKYEYEFYESAEEVFRTTVDIVRNRAKQNKEEVSPRWEPLFNNLGHCCRKTLKYADSLEFHQQALLLKPHSPQTYTAMGLVHALMGNLEEAISYFHKSLALNRDCVVTSTILKTCIEDLMEEDFVAAVSEQVSSDITDEKGKPIPKREPPLDEPTIKLSGMKLRFDEEAINSPQSDSTDMNVLMDMSMDI